MEGAFACAGGPDVGRRFVTLMGGRVSLYAEGLGALRRASGLACGPNPGFRLRKGAWARTEVGPTSTPQAWPLAQHPPLKRGCSSVDVAWMLAHPRPSNPQAPSSVDVGPTSTPQAWTLAQHPPLKRPTPSVGVGPTTTPHSWMFPLERGRWPNIHPSRNFKDGCWPNNHPSLTDVPPRAWPNIHPSSAQHQAWALAQQPPLTHGCSPSSVGVGPTSTPQDPSRMDVGPTTTPLPLERGR